MLAIYVRLSKEDEDSNSIENQLSEGKEFAKAHNLNYKIYNEGEGVSGTLDIAQRPQLQLLMNEMNSGIVSSVWMRNQNRLDRNSLTFAFFVDVAKKNNIDVYFGSNEKLDFNDPTTLLTTSILSNLNQYQAQLQSYQTKKVLASNAAQGKAHGILPYGYMTDENGYMIVNDAEAEVVERIFELSLSGKGTKTIAEALNKENTPTRYNTYKGEYIPRKYRDKKDKSSVIWRDGTVYTILKNEVYKGVRSFGGKLYKCPTIIESVLWQKVQDNLKKNLNNRGKKVEHKYMLKGLIICGRCGRNYYGRTRVNKKDNYYMCSSKRYKDLNCGNRSINIDYLEQFIWERFFKDEYLTEKVKEHLSSDDLSTQISDLERLYNGFTKETANLEKERQNAVRLTVKGVLSEADVQPELVRIERGKNEILEKQNRINEQLHFLKESAVKEQDIADEIQKIKSSTDFTTKKEVMGKYIKEIHIKYFAQIKMYVLNITFNLPIKEELYFIPHHYNHAVALFDRILIPLKGKVKQMTKEDWDELQIKIVDAHGIG
ncbi:recombinase family protein [Galbibacter pacificus]|uniref:Recombinase family protein n=1 Tax=Galbibacter pacificus TaxID=2996052 RepID=A0ABT6FQF8_9FLAO|nr:recombinase family protein [Galbibacter pacificus]MDG3582027.1 recombinase family protein [Galbibacter pacificus]MDG3585499.1 recombinase family protein [Galbibacter pacificus]